MTTQKLDWETFKSTSTAKNLNMQYTEQEVRYYVWMYEGEIKYLSIIEKATPKTTDQIDFEDNYQAECNKAIEVPIKEHNRTTGSYKTKGYTFTAVQGTTTSYDLSFPYDVEILAGSMWTGQSILGDTIEFIIAPDTVTGATTQAHLTNDTVINVAASVVANIKNGRWIRFGNDTTEYIVIDSDSTANTITLNTGLAANVATSSLVKMSVKMVETLSLQPNVHLKLGWTKIGSSYVPKDTIIRISYKNTDMNDKTINFWLDIMY